MRLTTPNALSILVVLGSLPAASTLVSAHGPDASTSGHGLGFGFVVTLTVTLGVLGGAIVVRRRRSAAGSRPSILGISLLLVVLGCWAAVLAILQGPALTTVIITAGAVVTWSLRNRIVGGHQGCDQAALGTVVLHRFVEGTLLATLYSADASVGIGTALALAAHTAAETGAIAGLWSTGRWGWGLVAFIQMGFVAGAFGGELVAQFIGPLTSVVILALSGGALIAAGVASASRSKYSTPHQRKAVRST